jgi:hypothetical protein
MASNTALSAVTGEEEIRRFVILDPGNAGVSLLAF